MDKRKGYDLLLINAGVRNCKRAQKISGLVYGRRGEKEVQTPVVKTCRHHHGCYTLSENRRKSLTRKGYNGMPLHVMEQPPRFFALAYSF
jgi:hypothetical protein